jgi:XTP/dITP diphosphohydrolase
VPGTEEPYRVCVATKNAGKLRELRSIFAPLGWELSSYPGYADVDETSETYAGNAALKARALRAQLLAGGSAAAVLGDDSGIEVPALGGRPGVYSARYGGSALEWPARRRALIAELAASASNDRRARFVCALHFIDAAGGEVAVERDVWGALAVTERGGGGFSYDPIFEYPPSGRTFAELSEAEKNAVSHRAEAARALVEVLGARP